MAKSPAPDAIMSPEKMKPLLALSKREPVHAAIALTSDGEGIILLDKKAKPRKVMSMLRADAAKAKIQLNSSTVRFGRAEVDTEYDAGMVRFFINKDAPGNMRVKLVELVKRIPYQKVEINVDPSIEADPEEEAEEAQSAADTQAATEPVPPPPPVPETVAAAPVVPPPPPMAAPDTAALGHELGVLMRRIPEATATDAALKARAIKLASDANAAVKANDADAAADLIGQLRAVLDGTAPDRPAPDRAQASATSAPPGRQTPPDAASLAHELAPLIKRIGAVSGADPALRGELAKLAGEANNAVKAHDLDAAKAATARLEEALGEASASAWQAARVAWRDANDAVGEQINGLRAALLEEAKQGDGDTEGLALALTDLAENGLNNIFDDHRVAVMAAVLELGGGKPEAMKKGGTRALALVEGLDGFIDASPKIAACDDNPYGASVSIRATLSPPLKQMAAALRAATAS
jgi:hypothetical protein